MLTGLFSINSRMLHFAPKVDKPVIADKTPTDTPADKPGAKEGDSETDDEDGEDDDEEEEEGELSDDEIAALPPKVRKALEAAATKAAAEATTKTAAQTKAEIVAAQKKKDRDARIAKATKDNDTAEKLRLAEEQLNETNTKLAELEVKQKAAEDRDARQAACIKAKLSIEFAGNLGTDPAKYETEAKKLATKINVKGQPDMEGGHQNRPKTKEDQVKAAESVASQWRF